MITGFARIKVAEKRCLFALFSFGFHVSGDTLRLPFFLPLQGKLFALKVPNFFNKMLSINVIEVS